MWKTESNTYFIGLFQKLSEIDKMYIIYLEHRLCVWPCRALRTLSFCLWLVLLIRLGSPGPHLVWGTGLAPSLFCLLQNYLPLGTPTYRPIRHSALPPAGAESTRKAETSSPNADLAWIELLSWVKQKSLKYLVVHQTHAICLREVFPFAISDSMFTEGMGKDWFLFATEETCILFLPLKTLNPRKHLCSPSPSP